MEALADVVRAGKARYIGASSMYAWQFAKAQSVARAAGWTEFVSMQNHYNLVYREEEREMIPLCVDSGVGVVPYSPLGARAADGSRERSGERTTVRADSDPVAEMYNDSDFDVVDVVREVAGERGLPPAQIALAWLLAKPAVTAPIVGATKLAHLEAAVAATAVALTDEETARLEAPYRHIRSSVTDGYAFEQALVGVASVGAAARERRRQQEQERAGDDQDVGGDRELRGEDAGRVVDRAVESARRLPSARARASSGPGRPSRTRRGG